MKILIKMIVIFFIIGCAYPAEKWTPTNYVLHGVMTSTMIIDWLQTREIIANDRYYETNPILGKYPTKTEVNLYFLGAWFLNTGITHFTQSKFRFVPQLGSTAMHGKDAIDNHNMGIGLKF